MFSKRIAVGLIVAFVIAALGGAGVGYGSGMPEGATYVGVSKCRLCHLKEHKSWKGTKHAGNFDVLIGPEREDPDCVRCHSTGYGEPGGFVSEEETPHLKNVGCEACHGPGSAHLEAAKKSAGSEDWDKKIDKVPQQACVKCHNPHLNQKERAEELRKERG